ncbi:MAG: hypothetical protein PUF72_00135 [Clostridiales bacterium]|nr:hypothetical protein [Clostridiales bacterium]
MLSSIFSWLVSAISEGLDMVVSWLLQMLGYSLSFFETNFPVVVSMYKIMQGVGIGLVLGIAVWNIIKFFGGSLNKVSGTPTDTLIWSGIAIICIFFGNYLLEMIVNIAAYPYSKILNISNDASYASTSMRDTVIAIGEAAAGGPAAASLLITLVMLIALAIELIKLIMEIVERYLMIGVLVYTSPLGWSSLSTENTRQTIFGKWFSMFIAQNILMILNVWAIKMVLSVLGSTGDAFMKCILALAFCKIARRFDEYLQQNGVNAAKTGGGALDSTLGMLSSGAMLATRTVGRHMGVSKTNPLTSHKNPPIIKSEGNGAQGVGAGQAPSTDFFQTPSPHENGTDTPVKNNASAGRQALDNLPTSPNSEFSGYTKQNEDAMEYIQQKDAGKLFGVSDEDMDEKKADLSQNRNKLLKGIANNAKIDPYTGKTNYNLNSQGQTSRKADRIMGTMNSNFEKGTGTHMPSDFKEQAVEAINNDPKLAYSCLTNECLSDNKEIVSAIANTTGITEGGSEEFQKAFDLNDSSVQLVEAQAGQGSVTATYAIQGSDGNMMYNVETVQMQNKNVMSSFSPTQNNQAPVNKININGRGESYVSNKAKITLKDYTPKHETATKAVNIQNLKTAPGPKRKA